MKISGKVITCLIYGKNPKLKEGFGAMSEEPEYMRNGKIGWSIYGGSKVCRAAAEVAKNLGLKYECCCGPYSSPDIGVVGRMWKEDCT